MIKQQFINKLQMMSRGAMVFFAVLSFATQCFSQPNVTKRKPNIVIIIADDQGYADVSYNPYHQKEVHTPNVDMLVSSRH